MERLGSVWVALWESMGSLWDVYGKPVREEPTGNMESLWEVYRKCIGSV